MLMGGIVLLRDRSSLTNFSFFLLTTVFATWSITNYFSLHSSTPEMTLFWIRVVMGITSFLGPVLFIFLRTYPNRTGPVTKLQASIILALASVVAAIAILTPFIFTSVTITANNITPKPGALFLLYPLVFFPATLAGFVAIFQKYRKSKGVPKAQITYLFLGSGISFTCFTFTNLIAVVLLHTSRFVVFGPLINLIMLGFITIAIIRHRFLDIRVVLVRSVSYVTMVILIALLYNLGVFSLGYLFSIKQNAQFNVIFAVALSFFISVTFQQIQRLVSKITETIFARPTYNIHDLLEELSQIMASTIVLQELVNKVLSVLQQQMRVTWLAVVVKEGEKFDYINEIGQRETTTENFASIFPLVSQIFPRKKEPIIVFDELSESLLKQKLRQHDISVILPLIVKNELLGGILIGEKSSGEIYSARDINVLKILSPQFAVAIKNALSYDQIRTFNVRLEDEVQRATQKLRLANDRLKQLDKLKDEFVSIASHELRTPMTAIKSYIWLALNHGVNTEKPKVAHYLAIAYQSTERLIHLVQDMLTISRIEGKHFELHTSSFDVYQVAKQMHDELQVTADEKKIAFTLKHPRQKILIDADKDKIREVLQNIVGNAIKFTPIGGTISITLSQSVDFASIKVTDSGPGISEKDRAHLFQKFTQLSDSYAKIADSGSGLGLYIAKQIVDLHHGKIEVSSVLGKGTTFTVLLPIAKSAN